ncbi:response regulator transcription factor [Bradyrhizobium jicamae]|uniref:response regulator transcription factor n=1 Tax=Bradyrhizobium jicamae TaxID=280332 RepID=UPI00201200CF|nr:response regulator [Bradyrhizobium jicamae]
MLVPDRIAASDASIESYDNRRRGTSPRLPADLGTARELAPVAVPLIAVVDDDEALCSSLADLMRSIGYRATPFHSAEALLESADCFKADCIIADIHMSGMGGLTLLRAVREQGIATPVILVTALTDQTLDAEAAARGALCLLRKPFEMSSLLDYVERSLSK